MNGQEVQLIFYCETYFDYVLERKWDSQFEISRKGKWNYLSEMEGVFNGIIALVSGI